MRTGYPTMKRGWFNARHGLSPQYDSYRHSLARRGIKTSHMTMMELKARYEMLKAEERREKPEVGK